jgi:hypothetical protein
MSSIVLGVVAAKYMPGALETLRGSRSSERHEVGAGSSALLGIMGLVLALGGLGIVLAHSFPRSNNFADIVNKTYPVAAVDALKVPGVRVFVFDVWSGLVIDRAWPDAHVHTDLRTDMYGLALSQEYQRAIAAFPDATKILDRSCTTHVLIRPRDALAQLLVNDPDWKLVRSDKLSVIYQRRAPAPGCGGVPIPDIRAG